MKKNTAIKKITEDRQKIYLCNLDENPAHGACHTISLKRKKKTGRQ